MSLKDEPSEVTWRQFHALRRRYGFTPQHQVTHMGKTRINVVTRGGRPRTFTIKEQS